MNDSEWLAERFEEQRPRLRSVAYRMLGSISEADDALQDAWLRVSRAGADDVDNMNGWLTTIVARVCLNMLRARNRRREEFFEEHLPDPIVSEYGAAQPEEQALLADSVGLALLVVLDTLTPAERLAFVLHDMFELPFDEIAPMVDRTPEATRQLASRARRRVKGADVSSPDPDLARQRKVVDAFFAAARGGDFDRLVTVLHPDVVLREDFSAKRPLRVFQGAAAVASRARAGSLPGAEVRPALVNGAAGAVITLRGRPFALIGFTVRDGKIVEIDGIVGAERVRRIAASVLG
jgi:RNA polymerase sigma factor (sigma-70 family)